MKNTLKELREIRYKKGISAEEVSIVLGKDDSNFINSIENGETELNIDILIKLCNLYDTTPANILGNIKKRDGFNF